MNSKNKPARSSQLVKQETSVQSIHIGPLPSASELLRYNQACPDSANRIIAMAENQQKHRINIEDITIRTQMTESKRGQYFAFILGLVGIVCSAYVITQGYEIGGSIFGGVSLTTLVSLFIYGKKHQKHSLTSKVENNALNKQ
jgi:uncharacterized membrane protein